MIDLHCHVLPGIDDGPQDIEESVMLARAAARAGTRVLVATPHVNHRYPNEPATIARLVAELNGRLESEGIALQVRAGAEVALSALAGADLEQLRALTLGGGPWLLVEPPFSPNATGIELRLGDLMQRGLRIVLAHPERCPAFHRNPRLLRSLADDGVLNSITAGSLVGRFGAPPRRFAMAMLRNGLVHNVASDAHDRYARPPGMAVELEQAGIGALGRWLTRDVPEAVLSGEDIPRQPDVVLPARALSAPWWRRFAALARRAS